MTVEEQMNTLTNKIDLERTLKTCKTCYNSVNLGSNIICHAELSSLKVPKSSRRKHIGFIINSSCDPDIIGHWYTCLIIEPNLFLICDGLNVILKQKNVVKNMKQFCDINSLKMIDLNIRYQSKNSLYCGFLSLFWISIYAEYSSSKFRRLLYCFKKNSIKSNEKYMLSHVHKHFKLNINSSPFS